MIQFSKFRIVDTRSVSTLSNNFGSWSRCIVLDMNECAESPWGNRSFSSPLSTPWERDDENIH